MPGCSGLSEIHCCMFRNVPCKYLEVDTIPGRYWVCGLMRKYDQDWDVVINSPEYKVDIAPLYEKHVWPFYPIKYNCKTWPSERCDCNGD